MYPEQIKETYLNLTPRVMKYFQKTCTRRVKYDNKIVAFGVQMAVTDLVTPEQEATGELKVLYNNGTLLLEDNFETIRTRAQQ